MSLPRYPKYKDSGVEWLGEVPEHWTPVRLKTLFHQQKRQNYTDERVLSVYRDFGVIFKDSRNDNINKTPEDLSLYQLVCEGDLVVNKMKAWQGSLGVSCLRGITSPDYAVFAPNHDVSSAFIHLLLRSSPLVSVYRGISNGIRPDQWRLEPDVFLQLKVFLPEPAEQAAIAAFLDREAAKIDALVAEQERLIELLKEKRQAVISHAVTKGLNPKVPMKDSGVEWLGEVPEHWEVKKLKHVSPQLTVGIVVEPSKLYASEGVPALRSLNVRPGAISMESMVFITETGHLQHLKSRLNAGDLVAVRTGQPGTAAVVPPELDGCNCIDLIVVRGPLEGSVHFLCWYLSSDAATVQFTVGSGGAIQQHFNVSTAAELLVPVPPPGEQREIVAFLNDETSKLDALTTEAQRAIDLLQERRTALISAAVTGQIDVRKASGKAA